MQAYHINERIDWWVEVLKLKINIYHKLKVSYVIRYVIIKHALVKELLILQVQNDDIKPW